MPGGTAWPAGPNRLDADRHLGRCYILWFLKARLFETAPRSPARNGSTVIGMLVLIMLGTINIRMAEMRERRQRNLAARSIPSRGPRK